VLITDWVTYSKNIYTPDSFKYVKLLSNLLCIEDKIYVDTTTVNGMYRRIGHYLEVRGIAKIKNLTPRVTDLNILLPSGYEIDNSNVDLDTYMHSTADDLTYYTSKIPIKCDPPNSNQ
jgi:hypothetical protein